MFVTTFALTCHFREVLDLRLQRGNLVLLFHHIEASTTVSVSVILDLTVTSVVTSVYELDFAHFFVEIIPHLPSVCC